MKYYPIDEDAARRAKNANSLSDYAEGSATSEYRREVNRAATLAEECKKGKTDAQQEKIDYLLDRYARRLADNMNASNRNRASCPSVMVAGWSNFPCVRSSSNSPVTTPSCGNGGIFRASSTRFELWVTAASAAWMPMHGIAYKPNSPSARSCRKR